MSTEIARRTPMQEMVERVSSDEFQCQVALALPETVKPERFARVAITALLQSGEQLAKCEPNSVYRALLRSAQDGLLPDGKEAALVAYNTKVKGENGQPDRWETRAQYLPMVGGLRKVLAEHGWTLTSAVIREADDFDYELGESPRITVHRAPRPGEPRGAIVGAYAQAKHTDGRVLIEVMDLAEIEKVRATSRSADRGPWKDWFERMAEKTPAKRLALKVPLGELDTRALRILEAADTDPSEAARQIYGAPRTETPRALPTASTGTTDVMTTSPPAPAERTDDTGATQQAAAVADSSPAAAAPGEPEPSLEEEQSPFVAPPSARVDEDPVIAAANAAAKYQIPNGDHKGLALEALQEKGDRGTRWLKWALTHITEPDEYRDAIWSYCRVYQPELYQAAMAAREVQA